MLPVLTFATGLIAGIVGVQLLKKAKSPDRAAAAASLERAQSGLRRAAVSGLSAVEKSSAGLRAKLTPDEAPADGAAAVCQPVDGPVEQPMDQPPAGQDAPVPARERDA